MKTKAFFTILAGSIAQLVHASTIDSNGTGGGNWNNPLTWDGVSIPDTYGFDNAVIHLGDTVDYDGGASTPGGIVGPGGLAVAGGQFITIDGGALTQSILTNEIRIGEGSSGSGDGILTIDNGGSFNSGASVAVAVGASLFGGPGSGIVNLNDGTFAMGAGAATGGLVVGVDGSTGVFNVGDGSGAANSAILDLATNNIGLGIGYLFAGPTGGTGTVTINTDGVLNLGTTGIAVGTGGGTATLSINGGSLVGLVGGGGGIVVGDGAGTNGSLNLVSSGSLVNSGELRIGSNGGTGSFTMTSGTLSLADGGGFDEFNVGRGTGANGTATISGGTASVGTTFIGRDGGSALLTFSNAALTSSGSIFVGNNGSGAIVMTSGSLTAASQFVVGANGTGVGHATITGGTVSSGTEMQIGQGVGGSGILDISGTAAVVANGEFQDGNDGGNGTVNMSGGTLLANSWFGIGRTGGTGVFNLSGGTITKGTGGATGTFDISTFHNGAATTTTGTLNQSGGDIVNTVADTNIGRDAGNVGFWNMTGGTATLANFHIGNEGVGTMNISGTNVVTINTSAQIEIGANGAAASGILNISNPNAIINVGSEMQLGRNGSHGEVHQSAGIINANGGWFGLANDGTNPSAIYDISGGELHVGPTMEVGAEGVGQLLVSGNAVVTAGAIHAGQRANGTGIVSVGDSASVTTTGQIVIGFGSANGNTGTITGGTISSGTEFQVGEGAGNIGTLNITGGAVIANGEFQDGNDNGNGTVNMIGGTLTANSWFGIGRTGGTGVFNLSGGTIIKGTSVNTGSLDISTYNNGAAVTTGTLNQSGGTVLNTVADTNVARDAGNVGIWNMFGGTATLANFHIGNDGTGTMNITGTDVVTVNTSGQIEVGANGIAIGVLNIDNPNATINVGTEMQLGRNGSHGEVHQTAGIVNANGGWFGLANDGTNPSALYDISGGQLHISTTIEGGAEGVGQLLISGNSVVTAANYHGGQRGNGTGVLSVSDNASFSVSGQLIIGFGSANANVGTISGGTVTSGSQAIVGEGLGHIGTLNITGGSLTVGDEFQIGNDDGNGTVNMSGGSVQINQWGAIGRNGGTGVLNMSGGTITMAVNNRTFDIGTFGDGGIVGSIGTGTFNQTGGDLINTGNDTNIGRDTSSLGVWNMTGGTATLNGLRIGAAGKGTMNISGTDPVTINANNLRIGGEYGGTGNGTLILSNPNAVINTIAEMGTGRNGGHGEVHQSAGILNAGGGWFGIANDPQDGSQPVTGLYDISGGQLNALTATVELGADGVGELRATGTGQVSVANIHAGQRIHGTGTLTVADTATVTASGQVVIGFGSPNANVANVSGGTLTSGTETQIGEGAGNTGTLNLSGTGAVISNGEFQDGNDGGSGVVNMTGGTLLANSWFGIGRTGGTGVFNLSGGTITKGTSANTGTFDISTFHNAAVTTTTGTLNQTGGLIVNTVSDTNIARDSGNVGFWNLSDGTANLANFFVGNGGAGTLNQSGGHITAAGVTLANQGGSTGTANLGGGTLTTQFIQAGAGAVSLSMSGGTMQAAGNEGDFLRGFTPDNSEVEAGGAIFDTNGFNVTVNNQFDGAGGLVKNGDGNLTVTNAANGNLGGTIVNRGNLIFPVISAAGPGGVDVQINAPGAAALDGQDLNPLLARTILTSNGAIALHDNTSAAGLDFSSYPNLSLGSVGISSYGNALTPGGGNYRLGGGGGTLTVSTVLTDAVGSTGLVVNGNGLTGTVVLTSPETYTGATNVAGGTLVLAGGTNTLPSTTPLTIGATGTVDLNGVTQTVGSLAGPAGSNVINTAGPAVFTLGSDNTNTTYGGLITGPISVTKIGTGTQTISAPQTYTALAVNSGAVVLGGNNVLGALSLANATTVTLSPHAGGPANVKTIDTSSLSFAGSGTLDLTNNAMVVRGGSLTDINAKLASGFNGFLWNGPGINSSTAAADASVTGLTAVGVINNADFGLSSFAGVNGLTGNEILVKYTYIGDADLNGVVNVDDFNNFAAGFNHEAGTSPYWFFGDFDYNGVVNVDDFGLFASGFTDQGGQLRGDESAILSQELGQLADQIGLGAALSGGGSSSAGDPLADSGVGRAVVPEPGSIGLLAVGAFGLALRRRRAARV